MLLNFLPSAVIRIVPLYWFATSMKLFALLAPAGLVLHSMFVCILVLFVWVGAVKFITPILVSLAVASVFKSGVWSMVRMNIVVIVVVPGSANLYTI